MRIACFLNAFGLLAALAFVQACGQRDARVSMTFIMRSWKTPARSPSMQKSNSGLIFVLLAAAVAWTDCMAGTPYPLSTHVPFGCYPARITAQTDSYGVVLTLDGTVPDVAYLVLIRTNRR